MDYYSRLLKKHFAQFEIIKLKTTTIHAFFLNILLNWKYQIKTMYYSSRFV